MYTAVPMKSYVYLQNLEDNRTVKSPASAYAAQKCSLNKLHRQAKAQVVTQTRSGGQMSGCYLWSLLPKAIKLSPSVVSKASS